MKIHIWRQRLAALLSPTRYRHSLNVMEISKDLADLYGADPEIAASAGLLHDLSREMNPSALLSLTKEYGLPLNRIEEQIPILLHGKVGAVILQKDWEVKDPGILDAIAQHVTGAPQMSLISQILFIADYAEVGRGFIQSKVARTLAYQDRKTALDYILRQKLIYLLNNGLLICRETVETLNQLLLQGDLTPSWKEV